MGALDVMLSLLAAQPWSMRCRFTLRHNDRGVTVYCGAMQATARAVAEGQIEVVYEHALHEATRERVSPEVAARLLLAILQRDRLCRVEVPTAESTP